MADQLKVQIKAEYTPDPTSFRVGDEVIGNDDAVILFEKDMTGDNIASGTQDVGTSEEALDVPADLGSNYFIIVKNTDGTNFVEVGLTGSYSQRIEPKEFAAFRANGTQTVKADTGTVKVQWWAFEK